MNGCLEYKTNYIIKRSLFFGQLSSFCFTFAVFLHSMTFSGQNECFLLFPFFVRKRNIIGSRERQMTKDDDESLFCCFFFFLFSERELVNVPSCGDSLSGAGLFLCWRRVQQEKSDSRTYSQYPFPFS